MITVYLTCLTIGIVFSLLSAFSGLAHLHLGHFHLPHPQASSLHPGHASSASPVNGFTISAFLCWFGGAGCLLAHFSPLISALVLCLAVIAGFIGAGLLYLFLFKLLLPRERVLTPESTCMDGVVARVSNEIRADGGIGEILFSQLETRRSAAARSEAGVPIARGTEVVVLRYARGIAYVAPLDTHLA